MPRSSAEKGLPLPVRQALRDWGQLIAAGRKEKNFTQTELAGRVGVGRMTVVRMEKGAPEVGVGHYLTAAWILGLPVLAWTDFADLRPETATAEYLKQVRRHLPERVRVPTEPVDDDF